MAAPDDDTLVAADVVPGERVDAPLLVPLLDATRARTGPLDEVVGDRGFDSDEQRRGCLDRDVMPQIPGRSNRTDPREVYDEAYRARNRVERLIGKGKQFRRFATRYEKLKRTFLGLIHLVFGFIRLRRLTIINTA